MLVTVLVQEQELELELELLLLLLAHQHLHQMALTPMQLQPWWLRLRLGSRLGLYLSLSISWWPLQRPPPHAHSARRHCHQQQSTVTVIGRTHLVRLVVAQLVGDVALCRASAWCMVMLRGLSCLQSSCCVVHVGELSLCFG